MQPELLVVSFLNYVLIRETKQVFLLLADFFLFLLFTNNHFASLWIFLGLWITIISGVKHGGVSVLLWGCFTSSGSGKLQHVKGTVYVKHFRN